MIPQTDIASSSSSPNSSHPWPYDVFLSFRGADTRYNFTDHLYKALILKGITTFRDDEKLDKGKSISELFKAIEGSRYVIAILSSNYADSTWCLDELAKAVECMNLMGQTILPIFYHVHPSEVRKQTGNFEKAFSKHEQTFKGDIEKVRRWRAALFQVANLSGRHLEDGYESELIETIVGMIFTELNQSISSVFTDLVGMDSHMKEMLSCLEIGSSKVRMIGIWGMGGMGKTTIAHVVSERIRAQFEIYSFLANVREVTEKQGLVHLQKKLLSDILQEDYIGIHNTHTGISMIRKRLCTQKVLLILDDVDQLEQLRALCGHAWFGPGSRIIITSRDKRVLLEHGVDEIYEVKALTKDEALQLFNWKSFCSDPVLEEFLELSNNFVRYANGLPLAIEVLASTLFRRSVEEWSSALARVREKPDERTIKVLKVSFDGLQEIEKKVFLDIACFFKGEDKDRVTRILASRYGHCPSIHIKVLIEKCLLTVFGRRLWMHDLIQELAWEIVRREHPMAGKRSRLWLPIDIIPVLVNNRGTTAIQGILLNFQKAEEEVNLSVNDPFSEMKNLRYLKIWNGNFLGNTKYLSNELALLEWHECPLNSLPSEFESDKLVELKLYSSHIKQLWTGEKCWSSLTLIDMSDSQYLTKTPDFTKVPNLEMLVLQGCTRLIEVHPSIGGLKKLILLNMRNCKSVERLPPFKGFESLKTLTLSACSRLKKFPEVEGNMKSLLEAYLDGTAIEELPVSIQHLTGLTLLNLRDCKNLLSLPSTIQYLTSLKSLILAGCSKFDEVPENLNCLECLEELDISGTAIRESSSIVGMTNLKHLSFRGCKDLPSKSWHSLFNCWWCRNRHVPTILLLPTSFSSLTSLTNLDFSYCNLMDGAIPSDFGSLVSLKKLNLSGNNFVRLPESIYQLSKLEFLNLSNCRRLQSLPKLPLSVRHVNAKDCISLMDFSNQFKVWTSAVAGVTTVNFLNASENQEYYTSVPRAVSRTYTSAGFGMTTFSISSEHQEWKPCVDSLMPTQVFQKDLELLDFRSYFMTSVCAQDKIPEWFSNIILGDSIEIPIPPDLKDNKKWMGVAAVFLVKGHPAVYGSESKSETSDYLYRFTLRTHEFQLEPLLLDWKESCSSVRSNSDNFLCFMYVSHLHFPKKLNESCSLWTSLETNNPCTEIQKCGIRLIYEQDVAGFIQIFMQCFDGGQNQVNLQEVDKATFKSGWL